ncbi:MAG: hypothetical protein EOP50_03050 [Sphingobacteriales bacterium]|nr:MAG: hypothetical protein EOP50_03050 [Sphingobacteriales bacterium]
MKSASGPSKTQLPWRSSANCIRRSTEVRQAAKPVAPGTVQQLAIHTAGGVVTEAQQLMV